MAFIPGSQLLNQAQTPNGLVRMSPSVVLDVPWCPELTDSDDRALLSRYCDV